jgi:hypothetical protein
MGIYMGVIYLHGAFPFTLSKLCMAVTYSEPMSVGTKKLKIVVYLPGEEKPSVTVDTDLEKLRAGAENFTDPDMEGEPVFSFRPTLIAEPITFKQTGSIKVRALIDDEEVKLGSLRVLQGQGAQPPKTS